MKKKFFGIFGLGLLGLSISVFAAPENGAEKKEDDTAAEILSAQESLNLRDPFSRPLKYADSLAASDVPELQRYALDQIKIVGIITGPKKAKALISTPNQKMHIVQVGDKIGNRSGVVRQIRDTSVTVREKVQNVLGNDEDLDSILKYPVKDPKNLQGGFGRGGSLTISTLESKSVPPEKEKTSGGSPNETTKQ